MGRVSLKEYWTFKSFISSSTKFFFSYHDENVTCRWYFLAFLISLTPLLPDIVTNANAVVIIPLAIIFLVKDIIYGNGIVQNAKKSGVGTSLGQMKENCLYLDYNATTPIYPEVAEAMKPYLFGSCFGNPSSSHPYGQGCRKGLDRARRRVAALVGARPAEIYFTSCGSESDHWAVESGIRAGALARGLQGQKPHAVACNVEHYAVFKCLDRLRARGEIDVTYVPVDARGLAAPAAVAAAVTGRTVLVTVMHAQNEVGALQDVKAIASKVHRIDPRILVHTDAAQSVGKVPVKAEQLGVDLLTLAGHKFGAPKGVAALYCRRGIDLEPVILGAKQEFGKRAGTENVALAVALGMAAQLADAELPRAQQHMAALRDRLERALVAGLPPGLVRVHGPTEAHQRLPNTLSVGFRGVKAPELKAALDPVVACSAGAACGGSGNAVALSPTLAAMGVPEEYGLGTLRLSLGRHSTEDEIDRAAKYIINAVKKLVSVP
mmetsp:Transcript_22289/g.38875  ORF Transcript_22289/g.38875 Transcript_22289/m.38875 type:complete len:492 (-) Transcript_22289:366-1841(-)|eukprot:CAMPEP_0194575904 /NCGR_PEP_ID=MMETSP0292-20121207/11210_1 /TAXON_ID=39354 /ORGANISM="Heterosigma akashiwo, Strain CCMP2393" /LENGTH=491 /DNA_ID=CAMNT_0039427801 /DNA_START=64 /DNA_END=1539 /DNA_ORIENTATION=+